MSTKSCKLSKYQKIFCHYKLSSKNIKSCAKAWYRRKYKYKYSTKKKYCTKKTYYYQHFLNFFKYDLCNLKLLNTFDCDTIFNNLNIRDGLRLESKIQFEVLKYKTSIITFINTILGVDDLITDLMIPQRENLKLCDLVGISSSNKRYCIEIKASKDNFYRRTARCLVNKDSISLLQDKNINLIFLVFYYKKSNLGDLTLPGDFLVSIPSRDGFRIVNDKNNRTEISLNGFPFSLFA